MRTVTVGLGDRAYPIHIGEGLLSRGDLFLAHLSQRKVSVVANTTVASLYLEKFSAALRAAGVEIVPVVLPDGEQHKNWLTLNSIFDALLSNRCERKSAVIALGGGVVGDLAGFAAERNEDRKSTRLNSSHTGISYAVFCLKKKKMIPDGPPGQVR